MSDFIDQDLSGARFERTSLRGATLDRVDLSDATLRGVDFSGAEFRGSDFSNSRMRGIELMHVEIQCELHDVVINGVDVAPLIEAELDRRMPDRTKMRPTDADGFRTAWALLERRWADTVARARTFPEPDLHRSVDGEWSFIQTLRHLNFAAAAWVGRMFLGNPSPWHPLDLPWDEAPGWDGVPWDRDARPSLDEVLEVRRARQAMVRQALDGLTDERLASTVGCTEPGWPRLEALEVRNCFGWLIKEEWEHRRYAERDLTRVEEDAAAV